MCRVKGEYWLHRALLPGEYHLDVGVAKERARSYPFLVDPRKEAHVFIER